MKRNHPAIAMDRRDVFFYGRGAIVLFRVVTEWYAKIQIT